MFINKLKSNNDLLLNEEMIEIDGNDKVSVIQQKSIPILFCVSVCINLLKSAKMQEL